MPMMPSTATSMTICCCSFFIFGISVGSERISLAGRRGGDEFKLRLQHVDGVEIIRLEDEPVAGARRREDHGLHVQDALRSFDIGQEKLHLLVGTARDV